jgi:hypothetical protein
MSYVFNLLQIKLRLPCKIILRKWLVFNYGKTFKFTFHLLDIHLSELEDGVTQKIV